MSGIVIISPGGADGPGNGWPRRYGLVPRPAVKPRNPRTLPQQTQRNLMAAVTAQWRGLSDNVRGAWRAFGACLPGRLSGSQAYVKVNVTLAHCGLPQVELPPPLPPFGLLTCAGLLADDTPQVKLLGVSSTIGADRLILGATGPVSAGLEYVQNRFREFAIVPGPGLVPADLDLTAAYVARFGRPRPGRRIFLRLSLMSNGFKSVPQQVSALVARHAG